MISKVAQWLSTDKFNSQDLIDDMLSVETEENIRIAAEASRAAAMAVLTTKVGGADNTGVTDCTSILTALLNGNDSIHFPKGTYKVSSGIAATVTKITGDSATILFDGVSSDCLTLSSSGTSIQGITIKTNNQNAKALIVNNDNITIDNCDFVGVGFHGIDIKASCDNVFVTNNRFTNFGEMIYTATTGRVVINANFFTGGSLWVDVVSDSPSVGMKFAESNTYPLGDGVKVTGQISCNVVITNNVFDGCWADAVDAFASAGKLVISNNIINNCYTNGLELKMVYRADNDPWSSNLLSDQLREIVVTGNRITKTGCVSNSAAISIMTYNDGSAVDITNTANGVKRFIISDNYIDDCVYGVFGYCNEKINIVNNIIRNFQRRGIFFTNANDIIINSNNFFVDASNGTANLETPLQFMAFSGTYNNIVITSNIIKDSNTTNYGIVLSDTGNNVIASHNAMENIYYGVISYISHFEFCNNIFTTSGYACINPRGGGYGVINGNVFRNGARGIVLTVATTFISLIIKHNIAHTMTNGVLSNISKLDASSIQSENIGTTS